MAIVLRELFIPPVRPETHEVLIRGVILFRYEASS